MPINVADIIIVFCILISMIIGYFRGLLHEILSIISLASSVFISMKFAPSTFDLLTSVTKNEIASKFIAYIVIFILSIVCFSIMTHFISAIFKKTSLKNLDRILGLLFGFIRGIITCCAIELIVTNTIKQEKILEYSDLYQYIYKCSNTMIVFLPKQMYDLVLPNIKTERIEDIIGNKGKDEDKQMLHKKANAKKVNVETDNVDNNTNKKQFDVEGISKLKVKNVNEDQQLSQDAKAKINKDISKLLSSYAT